MGTIIIQLPSFKENNKVKGNYLTTSFPKKEKYWEYCGDMGTLRKENIGKFVEIYGTPRKENVGKIVEIWVP